MSQSEDRKKRDLDLLMKSYKALEAEQSGEAEEAKSPSRRSSNAGGESDGHDGEVMMYRGRKIRKGSGSIPGAGSSQSRGRQFRGSTGEKKNKGSSTDQLKAALAKLTELHREGLITQAEYDAKRLQILDRL